MTALPLISPDEVYAVVRPVHSRNGFHIFELRSFADFLALVQTHPAFRRDIYVYRGHREASWGLESSLDRILKRRPATEWQTLHNDHLRRFALAVRGRANVAAVAYAALTALSERIADPSSSANDQRAQASHVIRKVVETWALGQHWKLATPLLDWSHSPLTALHFAYADDAEHAHNDYRSVFLLHRQLVATKTGQIRGSYEGASRQTLDLVDCFVDNNPRLLSQAGLFSILYGGGTIERWVTDNFRDKEAGFPVLLKFIIPNENVSDALGLLNTLGVNYSSVYPDIEGVANQCNYELHRSLNEDTDKFSIEKILPS